MGYSCTYFQCSREYKGNTSSLAEEPWGLYEIVLSKQIKDQQTLMQEGAEITAPITT